MIIFVGADVSMALRAIEIIRITVAAAADTAATLIRFFLGSHPFYTFLYKAVFLTFLGKLSAAPFVAACNPVTIGAG
jgi:hypothetical protein